MNFKQYNKNGVLDISMNDDLKNLSVLNLLYRRSPKLLVFAIFSGAVAGALYSLIIPFLLRELNKAETEAFSSLSQQAAIFFLLCISILTAKATSVIVVNNIAKSAVAELRIQLAKKINRMALFNVEEIGFARLLNVLVGDVNSFSAAAVAIPMLLVSAVTVIGMLVYLAIFNVYIFLMVLSAIFFGVFIFRFPVSMASGIYEKVRVLRDVVQENVRGLVLGAYELKLNKDKAKTYIEEELVAPQRDSAKLEKLGDAVLHIAGTASDLLSFFIIGFMVFILPAFINLPASETYGIVMALLYISGPVANIMGMLQHLKVGQIALKRINELSDVLEDSCAANDTVNPIGSWYRFGVRGVTYNYNKADASQEYKFSLGPVDLWFKKSQINFIVGGNGSGKSTLSKILSLHYAPSDGEIMFDDQKVNFSNIVDARSKISVIYSNYFLFPKIYNKSMDANENLINEYINLLGLNGKTEFVNGRFSTTKLSDGQRRRLALLVSLLEDKDIYIFDEWAADQDPEFKRIFYKKILKELKLKNKLVIVVTHDDRYFECADRVIIMEDGNILEIKDNSLNFSLPEELVPSDPQTLQN